MKSRARIFACAMVFCAALAQAQEGAQEANAGLEYPHVELQGFLTVGATRSFGRFNAVLPDEGLSLTGGITRPWSFKNDSRLGVQANLAFNPQTEAVLQTVSRYHPLEKNFQPEITWAFLRYNALPELTLRAGRLGVDTYLFADSRLVGYSYLTVRPPNDYLAPLPIFYFDGADGEASFMTPLGVLRGKLFAGQLAERTPYGQEGSSFNWAGSRLWGGSVDLTHGAWQFRLHHARTTLKNKVPNFTGLFADAADAQPVIRFDSLGFAYDRGPFVLQGMASRSRTDYLPGGFNLSHSAYLLAAYRIGQVTPYIGYSWGRTEQNFINLTLAPAMERYAFVFPGRVTVRERTAFLGARWDAARNIAFKAQASFSRTREDNLYMINDGTGFYQKVRETSYHLSMDVVF